MKSPKKKSSRPITVPQKKPSHFVAVPRARRALFWSSLAAFVLVPLVFSTSVYRVYSLPKYALLLVLASVIALLLAVNWKQAANNHLEVGSLLNSKHVWLVYGFLAAMTLSTCFGVAPLSSFFGSVFNQMGLLTHLCYLVCFIGLIVGVGRDGARLKRALWALALTGSLVAVYGVMQFFGFDPFLWAGLYTSGDQQGNVLRAVSTLGHSNYLGNFLLYTTPVSVGLAVTTEGRSRWLVLMGAMLSLLAILFSGTRGAWVGIICGIGAFAWVDRQSWLAVIRGASAAQLLRRTAIIVAALIVVSLLVSLSSASRSLVARAKSFATEGFTGAGRTILWRDSLKMLPSVALIGVGPEGFRKAFLAYKSPELARLEPTANNENPHNSYLDALIAYGLPGAVLYVAMIVSAFAWLVRARRRAPERRLQIITTSLMAALAAVMVHNFFIYNQISTGLYLFGFLALAQVMANITVHESQPQVAAPTVAGAAATESQAKPRPFVLPGWLATVGLAVAAVAVIASTLYVAGLFEAETRVRQIILAARAGNFNAIVQHAQATANSPDPTGAHEFLAVSLLAQIAPSTKSKSIATTESFAAVHDKALEVAVALSPRPLAHTLTPELMNVMLGYLALTANDYERLREYAGAAAQWDGQSYQAHYLLAKAYLALGEKEAAFTEAERALEIKPETSEAIQVRDDARGRPPLPDDMITAIIGRSQALAKAGDTATAQKNLLRAIRRSAAPCPPCHRELALVYEKENLRDQAIAEWRKYLAIIGEAGDAEEVRARIETLKANPPASNLPPR